MRWWKGCRPYEIARSTYTTASHIPVVTADLITAMSIDKDERQASKRDNAWTSPPNIVAVAVSVLSLIISFSNTPVFTGWYFESKVIVYDEDPFPIIIDTVINGSPYFMAMAQYSIKNEGRSTANNIKLRIHSRTGSYITTCSLSEVSFSDTTDGLPGFQGVTVLIPSLTPSEECFLQISHFSPPDSSTISSPENSIYNGYGALPYVAEGRFDGGVVKILANKRLPRYNPPYHRRMLKN